MVALHEQYRPRSFSDVVAQDKALATIERCERGGLAAARFGLAANQVRAKRQLPN
jgi:hypothetical protein